MYTSRDSLWKPFGVRQAQSAVEHTRYAEASLAGKAANGCTDSLISAFFTRNPQAHPHICTHLFFEILATLKPEGKEARRGKRLCRNGEVNKGTTRKKNREARMSHPHFTFVGRPLGLCSTMEKKAQNVPGVFGMVNRARKKHSRDSH